MLCQIWGRGSLIWIALCLVRCWCGRSFCLLLMITSLWKLRIRCFEIGLTFVVVFGVGCGTKCDAWIKSYTKSGCGVVGRFRSSVPSEGASTCAVGKAELSKFSDQQLLQMIPLLLMHGSTGLLQKALLVTCILVLMMTPWPRSIFCLSSSFKKKYLHHAQMLLKVLVILATMSMLASNSTLLLFKMVASGLSFR